MALASLCASGQLPLRHSQIDSPVFAFPCTSLACLPSVSLSSPFQCHHNSVSFFKSPPRNRTLASRFFVHMVQLLFQQMFVPIPPSFFSLPRLVGWFWLCLLLLPSIKRCCCSPSVVDAEAPFEGIYRLTCKLAGVLAGLALVASMVVLEDACLVCVQRVRAVGVLEHGADR